MVANATPHRRVVMMCGDATAQAHADRPRSMMVARQRGMVVAFAYTSPGIIDQQRNAVGWLTAARSIGQMLRPYGMRRFGGNDAIDDDGARRLMFQRPPIGDRRGNMRVGRRDGHVDVVRRQRRTLWIGAYA